MAEYIEREAMVKASCERCNGEYAPCVKEHCLLMEVIHSIPAADVRENKRGRWEYDDDMNTGIYAICSCCKESIYQAFEFYYCPNCGAWMEES